MSKYGPLENFLAKKDVETISMTFSEIESVIENRLPPSARKHRAWWSNNPSNSVITYAWLGAGYKATNVDMTAERLIFRRDTTKSKPSGPAPESGSTLRDGRHALLGAMVGRVTISTGVDLTDAAAAEWEANRQ
jgi:hypothetical protein